MLSHPNLCALVDVGEKDGRAFLVMERLQGETLAERLERRALPPAQAVDYGVQIAKGLVGAHWAGVVRRDLKPANVILTKTLREASRFRLGAVEQGREFLARH